MNGLILLTGATGFVGRQVLRALGERGVRVRAVVREGEEGMLSTPEAIEAVVTTPDLGIVCTKCWLAQTEDYACADELFSAEYAYFSSFSSTWLRHAEAYVAAMAQRLALGPEFLVVEVAANDGYLLQLMAGNQFDTIYHEHYSYLSLTVVHRIFARNGLAVFDIEPLFTQGGSLCVFAQRVDTGRQESSPRVAATLQREAEAGMTTPAYYQGFQARAERVKDDVVAFLMEARRTGKTVAGCGPAAKGNTLLNFWNPARPAALRGGPQPGQAEPVPARQPHPHPHRGPPEGVPA